MLSFNLGSLRDWVMVGAGETLRFDLPSAGTRQVEFDVISDGFLAVMASNADNETWLVGCGEGHLNIRFGMTEEVGVTMVAVDSATIFMKSRCNTQVVSDQGEPTFTNIEPRRMSQSDKVTRVQQLMMKNQERRLAAMMDAVESRNKELDEKFEVIEKAQKPEKAVGDAE